MKSDSSGYMNNVAIATTTMYDDSTVGKIRGNLAIQTIGDFCELGAEVYVVDSDSPDNFLKDLSCTDAHIFKEIDTHKGRHPMGKSRRQALEYAANSGKRLVVWTEPEKQCLPSQLSKLTSIALTGSGEILILDRGALTTYPPSQQHAENFGNVYWRNVTGTNLDVWGGVRGILNNTDSMFNFLEYDGRYGDLWDSIFVPVIKTIAEKGRESVVSVKINYTHPKVQTEIEERSASFTNKRLAQLNNLFPAIRESWKEYGGQ